MPQISHNIQRVVLTKNFELGILPQHPIKEVDGPDE